MFQELLLLKVKQSFVQSPIWILAIDPCVILPQQSQAICEIHAPEQRQYRTMFNPCSSVLMNITDIMTYPHKCEYSTLSDS